MITQVIGWSLYGGLTMTSGLQANSPASHSMTDVLLVPNFCVIEFGENFLGGMYPENTLGILQRTESDSAPWRVVHVVTRIGSE